MLTPAQLKARIDVSNKFMWLTWSDGSASVYCWKYGHVKPEVYEINVDTNEEFNLRYTLHARKS